MSRLVTRGCITLLAVTAIGAAVPPAASAHAILETTSPQRGAVVPHQPDAVIFGFDEPVEGNFGAVRVYDSHGNEVDQSDAFHPNGNGPQIGVHLKPGLPDGSYTATYRVVSADGHIVSSGFVFSIGKAGSAPSQTVAQLIGNSGSGPSTEIAFGAARALQYGATAIAIGGLVFLLLVWLPALRQTAGADATWVRAAQAFSNRFKRVLYVAAAVGAGERGGGGGVGGGGGRRGLGLLSPQDQRRSRGARHQIRHDLGTLLRRLGGIRPGLALCLRTSEPAGICAPSG